MLSPRTIRLLLRHFDALDDVVASRLTRKRPWQEEALTGLLCDLLDAETQEEERVSYTLSQLLEDLGKTYEPVGVNLRVDTHQYPKHLERWVTQSDFGLIINYQDQFDRSLSTSTSWLMQAKRLFPSKSGHYDTNSKFESINQDQHKRMQLLREWAGEDFIRYFLYCPRPKKLDPTVRESLNHARTKALSGEIFDYTLGLELRDDLLSGSPTVASGLFVASLEDTPKNLIQTHESIFGRATPFSWFLVQHIASARPSRRGLHASPESVRATSCTQRGKDIERLVRGDHRVLNGFDLPENMSEESLPKVLPAHTIEISVICGLDRH